MKRHQNHHQPNDFYQVLLICQLFPYPHIVCYYQFHVQLLLLQNFHIVYFTFRCFFFFSFLIFFCFVFIFLVLIIILNRILYTYLDLFRVFIFSVIHIGKFLSLLIIIYLHIGLLHEFTNTYIFIIYLKINPRHIAVRHLARNLASCS